MFARKIRVEYEEAGQRHPCPLRWLDSFSMRNFTNDQVFDDTVPAGDGEMEIGTRVPLERVRTAMEDWFRRKSYLPKGASLRVEERGSSSWLSVASSQQSMAERGQLTTDYWLLATEFMGTRIFFFVIALCLVAAGVWAYHHDDELRKNSMQLNL